MKDDAQATLKDEYFFASNHIDCLDIPMGRMEPIRSQAATVLSRSFFPAITADATADTEINPTVAIAAT